MNVIQVEKIEGTPDRKRWQTYTQGMTVKDLMRELSKYPSDEKVYLYTEKGDFTFVCRLMKDNKRLVLF